MGSKFKAADGGDMTKVGEGKEPPKEPSIQMYQKELAQNIHKFEGALHSYHRAGAAQKAHFKFVMDQSLALIQSAVKELKKSGIGKQEAQVEKDYQTYIKTNSPNDLSVLEEDLSTLKNYNQ
jgi:hypothetical protein